MRNRKTKFAPKAKQPTKAKHKVLKLSELDRKIFFDTLMNPPKASERLVRALAQHKQQISS